jgi:glycosyltransferase involved in cell wall biosynthesis
MNIVFIAHYFPPLNSTGARRVLAFSKYLSHFGHRVTVVTTRKYSHDGALTEPLPEYCQVIEVGRRARGKKKVGASRKREGGRSTFVTQLVLAKRWLTRFFGQLMDLRLIFAARFFLGLLPKEAIRAIGEADVLVSSSPPWPVQLAGRLAARRFGKAWLADYRDTFSGSHVFPGSALSSRIERSLDRWMLGGAAAVTVVSTPMEEYYRQLHDNVVTIENGFDPEAFAKARRDAGESNDRSSGHVVVRFMGTVQASSIPVNFLKAVRQLSEPARARLRVEYRGDSRLVQKVLTTECGDIAECFTFEREVPHGAALRLMLAADALLFSETSSTESLSAKGVLTTKIFEYLAAGRPIIADIEPSTLAGGVILRSGLAAACSTDPSQLARAIQELIDGTVTVAPDQEYIASFSRERQTRNLERLLVEVCSRAGSEAKKRGAVA